MKTVLYRATSRGHQDHGWLDARHTFSFANYFNRARMNFGALRVVNDDIIEGGEGFGKHPHDNMEIITIPLYGALEHQDSMGHKEVIKPGEIQVMSAGSGLFHSEYNASKTDPLNLFQIWIFPNENNVTPRYDQKSFNFLNTKNSLTEIVSPDRKSESLWLHQDTWLHIGNFDKDGTANYDIKKQGDGVFAMVIEGEFEVGNETLHHRDAIGIYDTDSITIKARCDNARLLLIEVPMEF